MPRGANPVTVTLNGASQKALSANPRRIAVVFSASAVNGPYTVSFGGSALEVVHLRILNSGSPYTATLEEWGAVIQGDVSVAGLVPGDLATITELFGD